MTEKTRFGDLTGEVALVTGCGSKSGIGFATARLLGRQGARVAVSATSERIHVRRAELAEEGIETSAHVADLTEPGEAERVVGEAIEAHGGIDILVNNAGMSQIGTEDLGAYFDRLSDEEWRAGIEQNLHLAAAVTRAALPEVTRSGYGRIVFVTSVTGPMVSASGNPAYSASKAGLDGLMRALAIELGPGGTTVNSVNPGWIKTGSATPDEIEAGAYTPVRRPGTPDEVAAAVLMLAAPEASYITGQTLIVDGGNVIQENKGPVR